MLDGFNTEFTEHNMVNGLMWGPDGWLYGRHGILGTSDVGRPGTPADQRVQLNCAIWRFHPMRHQFEVVAHGTTNPWGMDYNEYGDMFFTNNVIGHLFHLVPGAHYKRMYGADFNVHLYGLIDQCADHYHWDTTGTWQESREEENPKMQLGGGHSHCGAMIYLGDNWPAEYRGSLFTCNTHGKRVNRDVLTRHASGYVGRHKPDFLFANSTWFRGVELKYGPDGGVYLLDWHDKGECHDKDGVHRTSGRIYKITHEGSQAAPENHPVDVSSVSSDQLAQLQLHHNQWFARQARRILMERSTQGYELADVRATLLEMYNGESNVPRKLNALWSLYATGDIDQHWLTQQLTHENEHIRSWAVRLLVEADQVSPSIVDRLVTAARHETSGLVRLCLSSAAQRISYEQRWPLIETLTDREADQRDANLVLMYWYALEPLVATNPDKAVSFVERCPIDTLRRFVARRLASDIAVHMAQVNELLRISQSMDVAQLEDVLAGMIDGLRGRRNCPVPLAWRTRESELVAHQTLADCQSGAKSGSLIW